MVNLRFIICINYTKTQFGIWYSFSLKNFKAAFSA